MTVITEANGDGVHVKVGDGSMMEPTIVVDVVGVGVAEEDGGI